MKRNLYQVAREYADLIEKIERTKDTEKLQSMEETRVELHWEFIELLKKQGIKFKNRDLATRIALRIAKGEL
jgi:transposase